MKALLLLLFATAAQAELIVAPVVVQARHPGGATIQLHDIVGPCAEPAKLATFISADGKEKVNGCYKVNSDSGVVSVAWFDGDGGAVPVKAFRRPDET